MRGRAVEDVQWNALRELREGEPPTFPRLAAAADLHTVTIRDHALRDNWEKQPRLRSRAPAPAEIELPDEDVSLDEVRQRLAAGMPRQLARLAALAYCHGTPLRNDIEARDASRLPLAIERAAQAITARHGADPVTGKIVDANQTFLTQSGMALNDVVGQALDDMDLTHRGAARKEILLQAMRQIVIVTVSGVTGLPPESRE